MTKNQRKYKYLLLFTFFHLLKFGYMPIAYAEECWVRTSYSNTPIINNGCHIRHDYLALCLNPPFDNPQITDDIKVEYGACARMECCSGKGEPFSPPSGGELIHGPIIHNDSSMYCGPAGVEFVVYWFWQTKSEYNDCQIFIKNLGPSPNSCP